MIQKFEGATMSSREIAQVTGKNHKHVLHDCDKLNSNYQKMNMAEITAMEEDHPHVKGRKVRYYELTRMQTFDLVTGYNTELRIKVNRRWEELETGSPGQLDKLMAATTAMAESLTALATTMASQGDRLAKVEGELAPTNRPLKKQGKAIAPDTIDARGLEFGFAKINNHNVRRIIVNERTYYSVNDILMAIGVTTGSHQIARKLNRSAPHCLAKIHIFGNTGAAWFCTKKGLGLIKSGSRKLNGRNVKCELN